VGRKAVLYATCFGDYNNPHIGADLIAVLARNGVETEVVQPRCCGMPLLEQGRIADVAANARVVSAELGPWIDKGFDVIALVPSCALMLKFEWKLILPGDAAIEKLSRATFDISEYIVDIARKEGLAPDCNRCPARCRCIWPVTRGRKTWARKPPKCCA
jgi:glycerol-3-phosphate dehydrogenase subunit C